MEEGHSSYRTLLCWYLWVCPYSLWSCLSVSSHPGVLLKHSSFLHCSKVCDCRVQVPRYTSPQIHQTIRWIIELEFIFYSHLLPVENNGHTIASANYQKYKVCYYGCLNLVRAFEMKVGWPIGVRFFLSPTLIHLIDWWLFGTVCLRYKYFADFIQEVNNVQISND